MSTAGETPSSRLHPEKLDARLLLAAVAVCAVTRLVALEEFPIYFFTDEAANTVMAAEFVQNGLRDSSGELFPTYFANNEKLSLSLSVYAQVIPAWLFGRSVLVTRLTAALIALSGTLAAGLILRQAFGLRRAWLGVLFLTITPAWLLHSRTAFETGMYASMFAWSLYAYLRYRAGRPRWLPVAVLLGGLAFYSYSTGQAGLLLAALLLLAADARYHWQNRRAVGLGLAVAALLALPFLRFQARHPGDLRERLRLVDSYLVRPDLEASEKGARFVEEYAQGLSPIYWYAPDNGVDLIRHRMKGYGNILWPTLPLALLGLAMSLRRWRDPAHRAVLVAALTAPAGASLAGIQVTRALVFVIPAALLTALGADVLLEAAERRLGQVRVAAAAFGLLTLTSGWMLRDALVNGPTWYSDYGLTGMQYGAAQVFGEAAEYLERRPGSRVWIFPTWLNGADVLRRFFLPNEPDLLLLEPDELLAERTNSLEGALLILTREDYQRVVESGKFAEVSVEKTLPLPDGTPGFYLARMAYSAQADALFAAERVAENRMLAEEILVGGRRVVVRHTPFEAGSLADLFDGDPDTTVLTSGANPAVIEFDFGEVVRVTGLTLTADMRDLGLTFQGFAEGLQPARYEAEFKNRGTDPLLDITFDPPPGLLSRVVIEIENLNAPPGASVALRELALREQ